MTRLERATRDTFASLRFRNYRLFFIGQIVSVSGTWMQAVAQAWLVLQLTGSGSMLGITTGLQFLPILVGGPWAGVLADRVDKRRLLMVTQTIAGVLAILLGALTAAGVIQLWMVMVLAFAFGCVVAIDNPTRQSFVLEMVGADNLPNAVTLNSVVINAARGLGPAIGGVLIAGVGIAACFFLNGVSYLAVIGALVAMRPSELHLSKRAARGPRQLREGLAYVWRTPHLRIPLVVMAIIGTLTYNFHVTLPLLAKYTFDGGALAYGILSAVMGVGAVIGGLASARRSDASVAALLRSAWIFGGTMLLTAVAPTLPLAVASLLFVGAASIRFIATANAALQLGSAPEMRGRVMALWGVAFLGTTPLGGPVAGWIGETFGARSAIVVGAAAAIAAAIAAQRSLQRADTQRSEHAQAEVAPATGVAIGLSKRWRSVAPRQVTEARGRGHQPYGARRRVATAPHGRLPG